MPSTTLKELAFSMAGLRVWICTRLPFSLMTRTLAVSGSVVLVNESLSTEPGLVNTDPYGSGWLYEVQMSYDETLEGLLTASEYRTLVS